jgi:hypothetical protein
VKGLLAVPLAAVLAGPVGLATVLVAANPPDATAPSAAALADIPAVLLPAYQRAAATCAGLPWEVLAAVGKVESNHARSGGATLTADGTATPPIVGPALDGTGAFAYVADSDDGRWDGDAVLDRAVGPMQFLPGTWQRSGRDFDGDGIADPHNAFDAIAGAAGYLCNADGRIDDVRAALFSYNRSTAYVDRVLAIAADYRAAGAPAVDVASLLANPNLTLSDPARADLASGRVDPRLVAVLAAITAHMPMRVGVIHTGHSQCVGGGSAATRPGCAISNHWYWRAVDVGSIGGAAVTPANPAARAVAEWLVRLPPPLRPDELGVPWAAMGPIPGVFSDADHQDHLHIGFEHPLPGP